MTSVQWWCAARTVPWQWSWQPYPGVWIAVALMALWVRRRTASATRGPRASAWLAVALLWVTLDWPTGPVAASYLASVHALQFVSLAMVIPPLFWRGLPPAGRARVVWQSPLLLAIAFSLVMIATHVPPIVDVLMPWQFGSLALDALWLGGGLLFWRPVFVPLARDESFTPGLRMLYLFFGTQVHLLIGMWLLTRDFPAYATYELSPRIVALTALEDQQLAGAVMLLVAEPIVLFAVSIIFFRWSRSNERQNEHA